MNNIETEDIKLSNTRKNIRSATPRLSIGMPVYNGQKYIKEAIDSILSQTFTDFELIISDNASTDDTRKICLGYAARDGRVKYFRQEVNIGPSLNFKFVLDSAVGQYFMWAASDDLWDVKWAEELLACIKDSDFCVRGSVLVIDSNGDEKEKIVPSIFSKNEWRMFILNVNAGSVYYFYGLFFTKKLRDKCGFLQLGLWADAILVYSGLWEGDLRCVPSVWQAYRRHDRSVSSNVSSDSIFSKIKQLFIVNPLRYYVSYFRVTPKKHRTEAVIVLFIRYMIDQLFYFKSAIKSVLRRASR